MQDETVKAVVTGGELGGGGAVIHAVSVGRHAGVDAHALRRSRALPGADNDLKAQGLTDRYRVWQEPIPEGDRWCDQLFPWRRGLRFTGGGLDDARDRETGGAEVYRPG